MISDGSGHAAQSQGNLDNKRGESNAAIELTNMVGGTNDDQDGDSSFGNKENAALLLSQPGERNDGSTLQEQLETLQYARRLLCLSHFFAQFSEVSWQFCLTIFLAALTNYKSLFLVSTYGLTTGLAVTLLGSTTGSLVDRTNRLLAARGFIFAENFCVVLATLCCFGLLSKQHSSFIIDSSDNDNNSSTALDDHSETITNLQSASLTSFVTLADASAVLLLIVVHVLGAAARVLDEGFLVAMERDWVVVMSRFVTNHDSDNDNKPNRKTSKEEQDGGPTISYDSRAWLSETNVAMKQIDLSCKVIAPAISGFLIALVDNRSAFIDQQNARGQNSQASGGSQFRYAALVVGVINVLALVVEYHCTTIIYKSIPDLAFLQNSEDCNDSRPDGSDDSNNQIRQESVDASVARTGYRRYLPVGARIYLGQKTALAGIGLAMLYLNALTFDAILTTYLVWRGMGFETIGIWRGISSAIGLLGTCVYHWSVNRMTLELTGMWSIIYEFLCLSLSYGSLFVDDNQASLIMLIAGICASRIGLWVYDIAVTQMMQEYIPDGIRGIVGGQQQSLNAFFNLLSYALGIVFPDPSQFYVYVAAGYGSVGIAMVLYGWGTYGGGTCWEQSHSIRY